MKVIFFLFVTGILLSGCKEIPPDIDFSETIADSTYVVSDIDSFQTKKILIEEFSGVRCQNCPAGHTRIKEILTNNPGRAVVITAHTGIYGDDLTAPYGGEKDLRITDADALTTIIGTSTGIPSAAFDRNVIDPSEANGSAYLSFPSTWTTHANNYLSSSSPVNIDISSSFESTSRSLDIKVSLLFTQDVNTKNNLTVALVESGIVTTQKDGSKDVFPYEQDHILRKFITPVTGVSTYSTTEKGRVIVKEFKETSLSDDWDISNMEIVAFVHLVGDSIRVLQAASHYIE